MQLLAGGGRSRPAAPLALVDGQAPAPSSSAPPAGTSAAKWHGRCPGCGEWDTLVEERAPRRAGAGGRGGSGPARSRPVDAARGRGAARWRGSSTGIGELDRVLGGGLVPGSLVLIGGSPGIGKSTLTASALGNLAARRPQRALRVGRGVGGAGAAARRAARRAGARRCRSWPRPTSTRWSPRSRPSGPEVCVIDSVQMLHDAGADRRARLGGPGARGGRPADARGQGARRRRDPRGPRDQGGRARGAARARAPGGLRAELRGRARAHLPHAARAEEPLRLDERGRASSRCATRGSWRWRTPRRASWPRPRARPGSVVLCAMEGSRPLLVEVQALVAPTRAGAAAAGGQRRGPQPPGAGARRAGPPRAASRLGSARRVRVARGRRARGRAGRGPGRRAGARVAPRRAIALGAAGKPLAAFGELGLTGELRHVAHPDRRPAEAAQVRPDARCCAPGKPLPRPALRPSRRRHG